MDKKQLKREIVAMINALPDDTFDQSIIIVQNTKDMMTYERTIIDWKALNPNGYVTCPCCDGRGYNEAEYGDNDARTGTETCAACNGEKKIKRRDVPRCDQCQHYIPENKYSLFYRDGDPYDGACLMHEYGVGDATDVSMCQQYKYKDSK